MVKSLRVLAFISGFRVDRGPVYVFNANCVWGFCGSSVNVGVISYARHISNILPVCIDLYVIVNAGVHTGERQSVALLLSILLYVLMLSVLPSVSFAGNIYYVLGAQVYYPVANLFPDFAYGVMVMQGLNDPTVNVFSVLSTNWADFIIFPLYVLILVVLCYTSFLRRDVA